jgi:5-methylcytosine-specific restriction endonuclease McrA
MAIFEGTIQEFHHFLGPRIRNAINNLTRDYRKRKNRACEGECGKKDAELHSAHIHGRDRRMIIEEVLSSSMINGKIQCNIGSIEKMIMEAHLPIKKNFIFLCHACHLAYDFSAKRPVEKRTKHVKAISEKHGKIHRIKLWAKRPHQDNHKIIRAYLRLEKEEMSD